MHSRHHLIHSPQFLQVFLIATITWIEAYSYTRVISDWSFSKYAAWLKMYNALRGLRPDSAMCFCCVARVIVTLTNPFFQWVKLLIFFMFSGILKPFYSYFFILFFFFFTNMSKRFCFSVVYESGQLYMRKSCCPRNDSNPVHLRWCWYSSENRACTGFETGVFIDL